MLLSPRADHLPPALRDAFYAVQHLLTQAELIRGFIDAGKSDEPWGGPHVAMLAKRIRDGRAEAERVVAAVRNDLNRARGTAPAVFGVIYAENAHFAGIRYVSCLDQELIGYQLDGLHEARWAADAERLRGWFGQMPSGNQILAAVELEASLAAAARGTPLDATDTKRGGEKTDNLPARALRKEIIRVVRRKPMDGRAIANEVGRGYDYVRRILGEMTKNGELVNDSKDGYKVPKNPRRNRQD
jgi:hypothetical protein